MWDALKTYAATVNDRRFETLMSSKRASDFSASAGDMHLDYAKTNIDAQTRDMLFDLLEKADVISGSVDRTLALRWVCLRWHHIMTGRVAISYPMWTLRISAKCCGRVIQPQRW